MCFSEQFHFVFSKKLQDICSHEGVQYDANFAWRSQKREVVAYICSKLFSFNLKVKSSYFCFIKDMSFT